MIISSNTEEKTTMNDDKEYETGVFDNRKLDDIISAYRKEKEATPAPEKKKPNFQFSACKDLTECYRMYRELKAQEDEAKLCLKKSAMDELLKIQTKKS